MRQNTTTELLNLENVVADANGKILYYHYKDRFLEDYEAMVNASYIYDNLIDEKNSKTFNDLNDCVATIGAWSSKAIYALLGNISIESGANPDCWQEFTKNENLGYGLTQWSPSTKYTNWLVKMGYENTEQAWRNMDYQLEYLRYEVYQDIARHNGYQWSDKRLENKLSFSDFIQAPDESQTEKLAEIFAIAYERSESILEGGAGNTVDRCNLAKRWEEFFESGKTKFFEDYTK